MKNNLLSTKLKQLRVSPYLVNWYHSFLSGRQQRILSGKYHSRWKAINKGTTQDSISGSHLFNIFLTILKLPMMASLRYSNMLMIRQLLHRY